MISELNNILKVPNDPRWGSSFYLTLLLLGFSVFGLKYIGQGPILPSPFNFFLIRAINMQIYIPIN